jgi:transcriptional regulator GlxA family with amidase domain
VPNRPPESEVHVFGFFLVPNFALLPFASAIEALRAANRLAERRLYDWLLISRDGRPVVSSSGIEATANAGIEQAGRLSDLIVVAGIGGHEFRDKAVFAWLRGQARNGCRLGAMSLGSYVLARCGLLDGYRCTVHWENLASFAEEFPNIEVTPELLEIDRNRYTCSGGTAGLDLMLTLIAQEHGRELATRVADSVMHERIRDSDDPQRMALRSRLGTAHPRLLEAVSLMEAHQEAPLSRADLAARVGFSPRQLERLFRRYIGSTPTRYYLELRLERARRILLQTSMPILEVALACGFVSASHFTKSYREQYGRTPSQERRTGDPAKALGVRNSEGAVANDDADDDEDKTWELG